MILLRQHRNYAELGRYDFKRTVPGKERWIGVYACPLTMAGIDAAPQGEHLLLMGTFGQ